MEDEQDMDLTSEQKSKASGAGTKGGRVGRSRTLLLPTRQTGSRVRFRAKDNEDDGEPQNPHPTTPRSSDLKWMREIRSERNKTTPGSNQRASFGSFPLGMLPNTSSRASSPGPLSPTRNGVSHQRASSRGSSPQIAELKSGSKSERPWNGRGRERRSKSLAVREPRRRRSSSVLPSSHFPHSSGRGMMLQDSTSSSRDSDGSRSRTSSSFELGRSVSDRPSRLKTRRSSGSKKEGNVRSPVRSPTRSPQSDRLRLSNVELAMALPEEVTMEQMFKLNSDCSGSETETMSMKGIVSSLIAIENEEM